MKEGYIKKLSSLTGIFLFLILSKGSSNNMPKEIKTESGAEMVLVSGGWFIMGNKQGEIDEKPIHKVYVDSFYIDKYEVTQEEYEKVIGDNPSKRKGGKNPVEQIRWSDAVRYCNSRSLLEGLQAVYNLKTWECNFNANGYRLPTEAEWEYACRAGTNTKYSFGDDIQKLKQFAWFKVNSAGSPRSVGQKLPNPWGLYDMHGNILEWCNDFYKSDYYQESPEKNPMGPKCGDTRVLRGGCWNSTADECCSSSRYHENPAYIDVCFGYDIYGFRVVRKAK